MSQPVKDPSRRDVLLSGTAVALVAAVPGTARSRTAEGFSPYIVYAPAEGTGRSAATALYERTGTAPRLIVV